LVWISYQFLLRRNTINIDISPIETKKKYALVIDKLLDLIKDGAFKVDAKLPPERLMSKKLGVSRPSVREAYSALEIAGILESRAGSGTFVKSIDINKFYLNKIEDISSREESPYEILEVRKIIESEAAYLAAKNAAEDDISRIRDILEKMKKEMNASTSYSLDTDSLFHMSVVKASGNSVLTNIMKYISSLSREKLWENIREKLTSNEDHREKDIKYHEEVVSLLSRRDAVGARSTTRKHFTQIQKEMLDDID
jgi:DNA-binding FadR family transcriptional regulator